MSLYPGIVTGITALMVVGCAASGPPLAGDPAEAAPTAALTVVNPTDDTYALAVGGAARATVPPGGRVDLTGLSPGEAVVLAQNDGLHLTQRHELTLDATRPATLTLRRQLARLRVVNSRHVPIEVLVDGLSAGWAAPDGDTVLEGVPAGQRTLVARAADGPRAVRAERYLNEDAETSWAPAVPVESATGEGVPRPPPGQGLIWMRNTSTFDVRVFIGGEEVSFVFAGATAEIVVPPGTHTLVVHIEGADAISEHEVHLLPNQTAEWDYRGG